MDRKEQTSYWIRISVMKLEGDALDKIAEVVCTANLIRILCRCCAADSNSPSVGVFIGRNWEPLALLWGQNDGSVAINNGTKYAHTLSKCCEQNKGHEEEGQRTYSDTDAVLTGHDLVNSAFGCRI